MFLIFKFISVMLVFFVFQNDFFMDVVSDLVNYKKKSSTPLQPS